MKHLLALLCTLNMMFALTADDIKNIEIEDLHVYYGGGFEYIDALDGSATNITMGLTAFAPNIHELLVLEATASYSIVAASQSAQLGNASYTAKIINTGAYAGYMVESESPFSLTPKAGLQLIYASSSDSFGFSLAAGITASYELVEKDMIVFADILLISGATLVSFGVSLPFEVD